MKRAADLSIGKGRWARPASWLPLARPAAGTQEAKILVAVTEHGLSSVAMVVLGAYTVDWGDGSAPENAASGATASHTYAWADLPAAPLTPDGERQAIVTVTPQAGHNLTQFLIVAVPGERSGATNSILEAAINSPNLTGFTFGTNLSRRVQSVYIGEVGAITSLSGAFWGCSSLESVNSFQTGGVTTVENMFNGCSALQYLPMLDTANVTTFAACCNGCNSLVEYPGWDMSAALSLGYSFNTCTALTSVPYLSLPSVTQMSYAFSGCSALRRFGGMHAPLATTVVAVLNACRALVHVGPINIPKATGATVMFNGCVSLRTIEAVLTSSTLTNADSMLANCTAVASLPAINFSGLTSVVQMMSSCFALKEVPAWDFGAVTAGFATLLANTGTVTSILATGIKETITIPCNLNAAALDLLYTNLATVVGKTITVTGNPGVAGHTPAIATAKGWTVTA